MKTLRFFTTSPERPVRALVSLVFWMGVVGMVLGTVITFVPGAEQEWFIFSSALLVAGLFLPDWPYRVASVVLVAFCIAAAISGHRHGIEYRSYLQQRGLPTMRP